MSRPGMMQDNLQMPGFLLPFSLNPADPQLLDISFQIE